MSSVHMISFNFVDKFTSFEVAEHRLERTARLARLMQGNIEGFELESFATVLENLNSSQTDGSFLEDDLYDADVPFWIISLYSSLHETDETISDSDDFEPPVSISRKEFQEMISRMKQDSKSLMQCPIQISQSKDNNNTTLLVNHTFLGNKNRSAIKVHSFVVKKTNMSEVAASFIYNQCVDAPRDGIRAPFVSALYRPDEDHGIFINSQMRLVEDPQAARKITNIFSKIIDSLILEEESEEEEMDEEEEIDEVFSTEDITLMFAEKIQGNTVETYIKSGQYSFNTVEQKQAFFHSIGKVAMLDLMMGIVDRFLPLEYSEEENKFIVKKEGGMNLGNAMVVLHPQSGGFSHLVTIDNEILNVLNTPGEENAQLKHITAEARKSYLEQIQTYGRDHKMLASILVDTLTTLVDDYVQENSEFVHLQTDLQPESPVEAAKCVEKGLTEMFKTIQTRIIPQWNERMSSKDVLYTQCPSVMGSLEERIEEFNRL